MASEPWHVGQKCRLVIGREAWPQRIRKDSGEKPWTRVVGFSCVMVEMMIDRVLLYIYRVSIFLEFSPGRSTRVGLDSGAPVPSCLNYECLVLKS